MSMFLQIHAAHRQAAGLGALGLNTDFANTYGQPNNPFTPPGMTVPQSGGGWWDEWGKDVVGASVATVNNLIAAKYGRGASPAGGGSQLTEADVAALQAQQAALAAQQQQLAVQATPGGVNLFGTQISFQTLLLVGVGIFLLQSRGLERRSR